MFAQLRSPSSIGIELSCDLKVSYPVFFVRNAFFLVANSRPVAISILLRKFCMWTNRRNRTRLKTSLRSICPGFLFSSSWAWMIPEVNRGTDTSMKSQFITSSLPMQVVPASPHVFGRMQQGRRGFSTSRSTKWNPVQLHPLASKSCIFSKFHTEFSHRIPDENAYDDESHLLDILDLRFAF